MAIFVDDAFVAYETYTADATGDVEAAEVAVLGPDGAAACRVLGVYRAPDAGCDAFAEIGERAVDAASASVPLLVLGDLNVPRFDGARQIGGWHRAPKARPNTTPEATHLTALLADCDMTVVSGLVAVCGASEDGAASHFKPGVAAASELDFALADAAALALVAGGATENGHGELATRPWCFSHHAAVWVGLVFEAARQPPPAAPRFPPARWRRAASDPAKLEGYAAVLAARLAPIVAELTTRGLSGKYGGDVGAPVRAIVTAIHAAAAAKIGTTGDRSKRLPPGPPWWGPDCEDAAARVSATAAALSSAAACGDAAATAVAGAAARVANAAFGRISAAAQARFFEWRLVVEADGGPGALDAVFAELRAHLRRRRPRGGRGVSHIWRALRSADGTRLVTGAAVAAELTAQVTAAFRVDDADPRFCAATGAALAAEVDRLRNDHAFAVECADARLAGCGAVDAAEVERAVATAKRAKVPHPDDGVVPEALIFGGPALFGALARVFSAVLETGAVPAAWRTGAMRFVYKKGDVTRFLNHRGVVLSSHVAKLFERVLLARLIAGAAGPVDELQAVANPGVDVRAQLHLLYDACLTAGGSVWLMAIDITRGFPSTSRDLAVSSLRRHGARGRFLRAIIGLIYGTSVVAGLRPGVDTGRIPLYVGLLEGAVLSPALFAYVTSGLLAALRASGLGVSLGPGSAWCGALMLMDDLILLARSEAELREMAAVVFRWAFESRFVLALANKSHVAVVRPWGDGGEHGQAPATRDGGARDPAPEARSMTRLVWSPPAAAGPEAHTAASIDAAFPQEKALLYLGFRLSARGGPDAHIQRQLGTARGTIARMEAEYGGRALVTFNQALWLWTLHGRVHLEWPAAVLPPPLPRRRDTAADFETAQLRALRALFGRQAARLAYSVALPVFGLWRIDERRLLARARYAFVWSQTQRRPARAALMTALCDRVDADADFASSSITGAVVGALRKLGFVEWPRVDDAAAPAPGHDDADSEPGADDDHDAELQEGRPRDSDSDAASDEDGEPPRLGAAQRAWNAETRRRCIARVDAREAALWAATGPRSAALWREIAAPRPSGASYARLRQWTRRCVLNRTADARGAALVALICGAWWAAPSSHLPDAAGVFVPPRCGACRATSVALPLHLVFGGVDGEAPCPCLNAASARADWEAEVARIYLARANAAARAALRAAPPRSFRRLALMLGRADGTDLPWALGSRLPGAFVRTWGAWSAIAVTVDAPAAAG